ncbi:hypothetical protein VTK73DRAFT_6847 [Phialemonium thermophilum]|uniref:DUF7053 domain-containing protein n=1 Tax=Phialemonium thermophilum TaxID=223376 RepID=A0ABR3XVW7_9PEZI
MLRKKESFTVITPIPGFIPRQLAIDILHSHSEVITLNPLVLDHKPIPPPRDAQSDEFYSTWYEITERIQYIPGIGKMGSGTIKFNGCFHNMPWGLQTHIYAPLNVDLRNKYQIAGNQPGVEPPEQPEIGLKSLGAPSDGLYLREDIEIKCNVTVVSFVKAQLQKAGKEMVSRMIKKAELLDAGVLHAMIEDGKLKTINPADRSNTIKSPQPSPTSLYPAPPGSPRAPSSVSQSVPYKIPRPQSYLPPNSAVYPPQSSPQFGYAQPSQASELPAAYHHPGSQSGPQFFTAELPGDTYHPQSSPHMGSVHSSIRPSSQYSNRDSATSAVHNAPQGSPDPSQTGRWSAADYGQPRSRPGSVSSDAHGPNSGLKSPGLDSKGFTAELSTHREIVDENRDQALRKLDPQNAQPPQYTPYNPQDYASQPSQLYAGYTQQGRP